MSAVGFEYGPAFAARGSQARATTAKLPASSLHLTARGRRVVMTLAILLALAVGLAGGRAMASSPEEGVVVDVYTVGAGESLWSIASAQAASGQDVRDVVEDLMSLNELGDSTLAVGQQILVPVPTD